VDHQLRRRRHVALSVAAAVAVAAVILAGAVAVTDVIGEQRPSSSTLPDDPTADRTGPIWSSATASCVEEYGPEAVRNRSFSFDGTVQAVGTAAGSDGPAGGYVPVTFTVHEWYAGGEAPTVTVEMPAPGEVSSADGEADDYGPGSRLLVAGEPRWGGPEPLEDAIAWGCDFTRYHDPETAREWRLAVAGNGG
jgi:hypothetical protein